MSSYSIDDHVRYDQNQGLQPDAMYLPQPFLPPPVLEDGVQLCPRPSVYTSSGHSYINTPDSSASPSSLYFSGTSIYGSSTAPPRSFATTPLSSTSSLAPRNNLSSHGRTLQMRLSEIQTSNHQNFIHETPNIPKQKADKSQRSCMLCFKEKSRCLGDNPHRCTKCLNSTFYCKGPIVTPRLIDLESLCGRAALALGHQSQNLSRVGGAFTVHLILRPLPDADAAPNEEIYRFTIPGLIDDYQFCWDASPFGDVLDALVAVKPAAVPESNPLYNLAPFEHLCRRFCHSMSILRCLDRCTLSNIINHRRATHLVIGFISQLSRTAHTLLIDIFDKVRACCSAKRQREPTAKLMFVLTDHLGEMCKEIGALNDILLLGGLPPLLHGFFFDAAETINQIKNIARGLRVEDFNFANRSAPLQFGGLHVTVPSAPTDLSDVSSEHSAARVSFVEVLAQSTRLMVLPEDHAILAAVMDPGFGSCSSAIAERNESTLETHAYDYGDERNLQPRASNLQNVLGAADGLEAIDWEAMANAGLDPDWTLKLDAFTSLPNEPNTDATLPDPFYKAMSERPYLEHSADQVPSNPSQNAFPNQISVDDATKASLSPMKSPLRSNTTMNEVLGSTNCAKSNTSGQVAAPRSQNIQKPSKRKRISSLLSRKKQCVPFPQPFATELCQAAETSSTNALHTDSTSTLAQIAAKVKRYSNVRNVRAPRIIRTDWVANWDHAEAKQPEPDVVRDVNVPNLSRRPASWPLRCHLRSSLDISVAALAKLRIDSGRGI